MGIDSGRRGTDPAVNSNAVIQYVWAVIALAIATIIAIVTVLLLRPNADNTMILATIVGVFTPIMAGILALIGRENHLAMNSRLDQLLTATNKLSRAEGKAEGSSQESTTPVHVVDKPRTDEGNA